MSTNRSRLDLVIFAAYSGMYSSVVGLTGVVTQIMSDGGDIKDISSLALLFCFLLGFTKFLVQRMKALKPKDEELDL